MWTPKEITASEVRLEETVRGPMAVTSIAFDGVTICNAAEHIDWASPSLQLEIDPECLRPRSWDMRPAVIRQVAERICILPDLTSVAALDHPGRHHLFPPFWMLDRGAASLSHAQWEEFRSHCPKAPAVSAIAPISTWELLLLFRFQAPEAFLPNPFDLKSIRWDCILTTNGADPVSDIRHLQSVLAATGERFSHRFHNPAGGAYTVAVFIDDLSIGEWPVLCSDSSHAAYISEDMYFCLEEKEVPSGVIA